MFEQRLNELAARHLTRRLIPLHSGVGPVVDIAGREVLLFASNDYLGLARHPDVIQSAVEATQRFGAGTGASRLISGSLPPPRIIGVDPLCHPTRYRQARCKLAQ